MLYVVTEKKLGYENTKTVLLLLPNFISMNNNSILLIFF